MICSNAAKYTYVGTIAYFRASDGNCNSNLECAWCQYFCFSIHFAKDVMTLQVILFFLNHC